ncbi:4540_t:CDS:2, partial [Racocetra fulgida]
MRRKLTLIDAQNIALEKGGQCFSEYYINNKSLLLWKCAKFHEWKSALCDIKKGRWCPHCAKCFKLNIGIAKEIAFKKCAKKHEWQALLEKIRNHNSWCPKCVVDTRRVGLDLARNIARSKNGECLSDKYINIPTPLQWRCRQGHIWHAVLNSIKNQNSWCSQCAERSKLDINIAKEIALKKDGKCNAKLSIEEAIKIATKNKGLCLSETYNDAHTKLKRQCEKKHEWYATLNSPPSDIRRPDFLKTSNHPLGLELDIYYPQYGFAIEVQ